MSTRHHKGKGFSQTSKRYDGALKAQHQQSRNKQMDHPSPHVRGDEVENEEASSMKPHSVASKIGRK